MPHFPKPFFRRARGLWYVQLHGKQINLGPDKDEAFRQYHLLLSQPEVPTISPSGGRSVAVLCDHFLEWSQRNRAAATYEWYRYRLQRFVETYPNLTTDELRPHHAEQWAGGLSNCQTSHRNYLRSIKRCMKWATRQGFIDKNPIEHLEVPSGEAKEIYVPPDEFAQLCSFIRNQPFIELVTTTYECGCRPQESLRVEARHVDLKNSRWVFPQSEAKGKKAPRIVYLSEASLEITKRRMKEFPFGRLFRNSRDKPWTPASANCAFNALRWRMGQTEMKQLGEVISDEAVTKEIKRLKPKKKSKGRLVTKSATDLKVEAKQKLMRKRATKLAAKYSLYAFRHSFATNALKRGLDALTVAILMGHQDPSTLARVYQHLSHNPEHMLEQARRAAG